MLRRALVQAPRAVQRTQVPLARAVAAPQSARLVAAAARPARHFASSSASDGAKDKKDDAAVEDDVQQWLKKAVQDHKVLLFMKGTPEAPQCGFSRKVAVILKEHNAVFASANVLNSADVREGIKVFSNWPTLPQLYIGGEFVGGCDIVTSLAESGELKEKLEKAGAIRKL